MHHTGWSERAASSRHYLRFAAHLDFRIAFEDHIELVLPGVRVRRVFLAGLKTIEAREQGLALRDSALRHLLGREFGEPSQVFDDHRT